jgi:hypothetical protein
LCFVGVMQGRDRLSRTFCRIGTAKSVVTEVGWAFEGPVAS